MTIPYVQKQIDLNRILEALDLRTWKGVSGYFGDTIKQNYAPRRYDAAGKGILYVARQADFRLYGNNQAREPWTASSFELNQALNEDFVPSRIEINEDDFNPQKLADLWNARPLQKAVLNDYKWVRERNLVQNIADDVDKPALMYIWAQNSSVGSASYLDSNGNVHQRNLPTTAYNCVNYQDMGYSVTQDDYNPRVVTRTTSLNLSIPFASPVKMKALQLFSIQTMPRTGASRWTVRKYIVDPVDLQKTTDGFRFNPSFLLNDYMTDLLSKSGFSVDQVPGVYRGIRILPLRTLYICDFEKL